MRKYPVSGVPAAARCAVALSLCAAALPSYSMEIKTTDPDLKVRWDNSVKLSTAFRLKDRDDELVSSPNADDGDRNFGKGVISERFDLLSEFDVQYKQFGMRMSGAAWYDAVYNQRNDNNSPATANVTPHDKFSSDTRRIHGRNAELLDAFFAVNDRVGDMPYTLRVGQHAMTWGETLFFGANGAIGQMVPLDLVKGASVPNIQVKELMLPVPMVSGQLQLTPDITLGAYYQITWEPTRLAAAGSYFSTGEITQGGSEPWFFVGSHLHDHEAKNSGQGGIQLKYRGDETDYGIYWIRSHSKTYQPVVVLGANFTPVGYRLDYKEDIDSFGFSASRSFDEVNWAGEVSYRHGQGLASTHNVDASAATGDAPNNSNNPAFAVGNTLHVNTSAIWAVPRNTIFNESSLTAELAFNRVLSVTHNPVVGGQEALDPNATRNAWAVRAVFEPMFRSVFDGIDISTPIGLGWAPHGSRSMAVGPFAMPTNGNGDLSFGAQISVYDQWYVGANYTRYLGTAGLDTGNDGSFTYQQSLKDRDFVSLSVRTTF